MKKRLVLQAFCAMLLTLAIAFFVSCSHETVQVQAPQVASKSKISGARIARLAPGYLSGHWKLTAFYSSYAPQRKSIYENSLNCSLSDRWLYISPNNYNIQITNQNGCRNQWLGWSQPSIDYFVVGNQQYENVTYQFAPASDTSPALFDLYRGNPWAGANVYYTTVTWNEPYYSEMTLLSYDGAFAAVYRRADAYDNVPIIY